MREKNQLAKDRAAVLRLLERSGQRVAEFGREQGLPYGLGRRDPRPRYGPKSPFGNPEEIQSEGAIGTSAGTIRRPS
jgi:hypothetical protein